MSNYRRNRKTTKRKGGDTREKSGARNNNSNVVDSNNRPGRNNVEGSRPASVLAQSFANLALSKPDGYFLELDPFNVMPTDSTYKHNYLNAISVPAAMVLEFAPTIGKSKNAVSPINQAAANAFAFVRSFKSGPARYDSPDLMLYMLTMDSYIMAHSYFTRVYGLLQSYSKDNHYYPEAIIEAMGFDYDDLYSHLNDLRGLLNMFAINFNKWNVPKGLPFLAQHLALTSNIYVDEQSTKAQSYIFKPVCYLKYDYTAKIGSLKPHSFKPKDEGRTQLNFEDIKYILNDMMMPWATAQDFADMSSDIRAAFGDGNLLEIGIIPEDYRTPIVYDPGMLVAIENATIAPIAIESLDVTYSPQLDLVLGNALVQDVMLKTNVAKFKLMQTARIANFHGYVPTADDMMLATTFMCSQGSKSPGSAAGWYTDELSTFGTAIICGCMLVSTYKDSAGRAALDFGLTSAGVVEVNTMMKSNSKAMKTLTKFSAFEHHPTIYIISCNRSDEASDPNNIGTWEPAGMLCSMDNVYVVPDSMLNNMHAARLIDAFNFQFRGN